MPSSTSGEEAPALPNGFVSIEKILDGVIPKGKFTNVIGLVKDCRLPIPTKGTDYKCAITLYDLSTEGNGIDLTVFRPENEMPVVSAADVVLLKQVRVQQYGGSISLITNYITSISVYKAARIPKPPSSAHIALMPPSRKKGYREPTEVENNYVSQMFHRIDKYDVPDEQDFQEKSTISLNIKQKFSLLQDVEDSRFYDLTVRVARDPYDQGDKVTLYVTDYTENDSFFNYTREGVEDLDTRGDVWGYTNINGKENDDREETGWVGPYGKKALQVTVFDSHAEFARENLRAGMWLNMKNVWIKHGSDGRYLEGYVRQPQNQTVSTNHLIVLGRESKDPNLEAALKRCKASVKEATKKADAEPEHNKRKRDEDSAEVAANPRKKASLNSNQRRKLKRQQERAEAQAQAKSKNQSEAQRNVAVIAEQHAANDSVACEHPDKPITPLSAMIEHQSFEIIVNGETLSYPLPFVNNNYRAHVRVVDFKPFNLEEFAVSRNQSNWEDGEDTDDPDGSGTDASSVRGGGRRKIWEWAFELCLEDATSTASGPKTRQWVTVDNFAAQCLTGLDASDLRQDRSNLTSLREKMFYLWGELEEKKHNTLALRKSMMQQRRAAPPPTASQEEDGETEVNVNNVPFTCCIRQWGVEVKENGEKKWQRMFGMFGTKIAA